MKKYIPLFISFFILLGCAKKVELSIKPNFDFWELKNVGVVEFSTPKGKQGKPYGQLAADLFSMEMLNLGFSVIERSQLEKVMEELKLGQTGTIDAGSAQNIGKIAGVDALVMGSLQPAISGRTRVSSEDNQWISLTMTDVDHLQSYRRRPLPRRRPASRRGGVYIHTTVPPIQDTPAGAKLSDIIVTSKMIMVETGQVLWVANTQSDKGDAQSSLRDAVIRISKALRKKLFK